MNGMSAGKTASPGARSVWAIAVKFAACPFVGLALLPTAVVRSTATLRYNMGAESAAARKAAKMGALIGSKSYRAGEGHDGRGALVSK